MTPQSSGPQWQSADWEYGPLSARVYELDKPVGSSLNGDVEFYSQRLSDIKGPILEPAVGTGRVLLPLLRAGLDVTGYDTSGHMLEICRANMAATAMSAEIFTADMATYRSPGTFAAIALPTGSIILLPDRDAVVAALRNMRDSLRPGGILIIDVPAADLSGDTGPLRHWWDGEELLTLRNMHTDIDMVRQKITTWLRYELWRNGRLTETQLQLGGMLWFGIPEFTVLLREAGFADVTVYGDYRPDIEPEPGAAIWTFEATRWP